MKTKEAIERVRSRFDKWALDEEDLEAMRALGLVTIESEDEKIRKFLIDFIKLENGVNLSPDDAERCIAYLEKQKEQKHSLNFEAISSWLRDHVSRYVNSEYNEFHHCTEYDGTINVERLIADLKVAVNNGAFNVDAAFDTREPRDNWEYIKEFCDKFGRMPKDMDELDALVSYVMDKKQKEQKPVTLDESVKLGLDRALYIVKHAKGNLPAYQTDDGVYECDHAIQTLESILKNGIEQKPAEWSKDERIRKDIIQFFKDAANSKTRVVCSNTFAEWAAYLEKQKENPKTVDSISPDCASDVKWADTIITRAIVALSDNVDYNRDEPCKYRREIDGLKKLRVILCGQKVQKSAEWSEGIKKTLDEISNYLKYKGREEDADFIRNLRPQPHWKPSKEQIKAIDLAMRFVTDDFDEHPTLSETLDELYNELKKL